MTYYYKLRSKSELGKMFRRLWNRCVKAERAADAFARKSGAEQFYPSGLVFAGGVEAVLFKDDECPKSELWQHFGEDDEGRKLWRPRKYEANNMPRTAKRDRGGVPLVVRKAMRIEKERLALPVVKTETILQLLQADPTCGKADDGKVHIVRVVTPTFFEYWNHIYIGIAYPCHAEALEEITQADYIEAEKAVREMARHTEVAN